MAYVSIKVYTKIAWEPLQQHNIAAYFKRDVKNLDISAKILESI